MTLESNQNLDPDKLSVTARRMLELREAVFTEWEKRLRMTVKEATSLPHPILINTFPTLYDNLVEVIADGHPRAIATGTTTIASEHGGERARLTNYNPQSVVAEYQLLRWTILDVLRLNDVQLDNEEFFAINASIDSAIRESVNAFALAQAAFRERFVLAVTHDLRNPLHVVGSAAELMLYTDDLAKIKELAAMIIENKDRMDKMIQDLLDTILFQTGERLRLRLSSFDILGVIKEVCDQSTAVHGPRFEVIGESVSGWWGRDAVKRAVENLVGNAVKYGYSDTPIRIRIEAAHERVMLTVHNEGEPIPPEQLESIFQVFQRAAAAKEGKRQGWGIGLAYVRSVAESHGGSVSIDSSADRGTTLTFDMPIDARPYQNAPTLGQAN